MSWHCKWIAIEIVIDTSFWGVGIGFFSDWKYFNIHLPFLSIVFNFSGEWAGGYKRP
ncbi:MAG: hypothetical protein J6Z11_17270 [Candidatus Riflebacteria bacterium]|nr:hypothetical protein [Candidatus Riflebacteria bacterium]